MTGWFAPALLALAVAVMLWRLRMPPVGIAAALAVGLAGYTLEGVPSMKSALPPPPAIDAKAAPEATAARARLIEQVGDVAAWMALSDALIREGKSAEAVEGLRLATRGMPDSPDLWVAFGNALVQHADGMISPAARLAFGRASALAPDHPAPPYFLALAWVQAGEPDEAVKVLTPLLARTPADAPYRAGIERLLRGARAMVAAGVDGGRFASRPAAAGQ